MKKITIFILITTIFLSFEVFATRKVEYGLHLPDKVADFSEDFEGELSDWTVEIGNGSNWHIFSDEDGYHLTSGPVDTWGADKETLISMNEEISEKNFSFSADVCDKRYGAMASLVFKYTSPAHFYSLRMLNIDDVDYIGFYRRNGVTLWEEENLTLVKFPGDIRTPGTTFRIKVEIYDNKFVAYVNDKFVTEYTEDREYFSGNKIGIFQSYGEPTYDNVEIFYEDEGLGDIEFLHNRQLLSNLGILWDIKEAKDGNTYLTNDNFDYFMEKLCFAPKGNNESDYVDFQYAVNSFLKALGYDKTGESLAFADAKAALVKNTSNKNGNINLRDFMQMAVNSLDIDVVKQVYGKADSYVIDDGKTFLNIYHGIYCDESVLVDNAITSINGGRTAKKGQVGFENGFVADEGNTKASDYIGYNMQYYYRLDDVPELLFIRLDPASELFLCSDEIVSYKNNVLTYRLRGESKEKKEKIPQSVLCVYNGKYTSSFNEDMMPDTGDITLVRNGRTDVLIINSYQDVFVEKISVDEKMIFDKLTDTRISWKDAEWTEFYGRTFKEIPPSDIFENDVVSFARSRDGKINTFVASGNSVFGEVELLEGDNCHVVISGNTYRLSKNFFDNSFVAPGDKGTLYLNFDGCGVYFKHDAEVSYTAAYLVESSLSGTLDERVKIQLFDGELKVYPCSKTVKINDDVYKNNTFFNIINNYQDIFEYRLNSKGEISYIGIPRESYASYNGGGLTEMGRFMGGTYYKSDTRSFSGFLLADKNVKVFLVPLDRSRTDAYALADISYFKNDVMYYSLVGYSHGGNEETAEYIVSEFDTYPQYQLNPACIVENIKNVLTDDGRDAKMITVRYDEGDVRDVVLSDICTLEGAEVGDIIQYSENLNGEVHAIVRVFDHKSARLFHYGDMYYTASYRLVYGTVYDLRKNSFIFERADAGREIVTLDCPIIIYDTTGRERKIYSGTYEDIRDSFHFGADADKMLIRFEYGVPRQMIIYR